MRRRPGRGRGRWICKRRSGRSRCKFGWWGIRREAASGFHTIPHQPQRLDMADEPEPSSGAMVPVPPQPPPVRLEIATQGMATTYANFFRVAGTFEELLLDFGFHTGLVGALQAAVQRHEQTFGPVETDPQKRVRRP